MKNRKGKFLSFFTMLKAFLYYSNYVSFLNLAAKIKVSNIGHKNVSFATIMQTLYNM